jgi:ABC-type branched-subunit amino acid transport system ATPase component
MSERSNEYRDPGDIAHDAYVMRSGRIVLNARAEDLLDDEQV